MGGEDEHGAKALASGLHAVAHGLVEASGRSVRGGQSVIQGIVDLSASLLPELVEGGSGGILRGHRGARRGMKEKSKIGMKD